MIQKNLYGLIGFPLTHSFSKKYFTEKFENEKILNTSYELFPIENIDLIKKIIQEHPTLKGLNITIPYKQSVLPFLDEVDETAKKIGAVNCIKILPTKNQAAWLIGFNTDEFGFRQSIKPFLESHHERALILGTGGSSKAIEYVLKQIGIECYFVSRNKSSKKNHLVYEEVNNYVLNSFKLIINCTPIGMFPNINQMPDIPYEFISSNHLLYDLIYNPAETAFLKKGKEKGASIINGLSMLQLQAEKSWEIWNS